MNIVYINHYAGSMGMGMEFRPYYLAREWARLGHTVSIIAGNYSHLRNENPTVTRDMQKTRIDGIDYYWLKTGVYSGNGVTRALTMVRFCRKLYQWSGWIEANLNPDVVISSSTYPIDSIPAHSIAAHGGDRRVMHIHEVHDMWPSTLIEIGGMSKSNPFVMLMQYGENYAYSHADIVVSLLKNAKTHMVTHGLKPEKFRCIQNGIVKEEWENPAPLPEAHLNALASLKSENKFVVGYFGGHALSNCLMPLICAAKEMQGEGNIHFVLVGDGVEKKALMKAAEGLGNITFLPPVNKDAVPTLTRYFDCIYIGAKDSPLYRFGVCMNKMFDGMMTGKPIVFAINAPTTPVEECRCGLIVKPEDTEAIVGAIHEIAGMPEAERDEMGRHGRQEVMDKYMYDKIARDFLDVIKE